MRRVIVSLLAAALAAGCITPSIPIPPPDPTEMMFHFTTVDMVSHATFTYPPDTNYCGGVSYLFDRELGSGVIHTVNSDCSVGPLEMAASPGDNVDVTIETNAQTASTCVVLQEGAQSPNVACAP